MNAELNTVSGEARNKIFSFRLGQQLHISQEGFMITKVASINKSVISLENGICFTLPPADIEKYAIAVNDQVVIFGNNRERMIAVFQPHQHKAEIALTQDRQGLSGRVIKGTSRPQPADPASPFSGDYRRAFN